MGFSIVYCFDEELHAGPSLGVNINSTQSDLKKTENLFAFVAGSALAQLVEC